MEAMKQKLDGSPQEDVRLPESVEAAIRRITVEKQPPPMKCYARKMLREIGEQASLEVLNLVRSTSSPINNFSAYVSKVIQNRYPIQAHAVLSQCQSRQPSPLGISSASPNTARSGKNLHFSTDNLQRTGFQDVSRQLSFEDDAQESRCCFRDASSLSREHKRTAESTTVSQQLLILNKLEHRKLFLLLSYVKGKLEAVFTIDEANEVYSMKDLPMADFETNIWNRFHHKFNKPDRVQYLDWDPEKTHIYYCHVDVDGSYYFKGPCLTSPRTHLQRSLDCTPVKLGPCLTSPRTHLQRSLGDDNVLTVKFLENGAYPAGLARKIVEEGLFVGLRRYRFFVFKDERKKAKKNKVKGAKEPTYSAAKCYFVRFDSISLQNHEENYVLLRKSVSKARRLFMHIHTLSTFEKYMARFSLILSKTTKINLDFAAIIVEIIKDIPFQDKNGSVVHDEDGKPILHTDATGYISEDLAMKCSKDLHASMHNTDSSVEPLLLIQCRLFHDGDAVKGTLLVNRKLEPGRIQVRPSMIKVKKDQVLQSEKIYNSLEINTASCRPHRNYLSKNLIALLSYGGVPPQFFLNLLMDALKETQNVYSNRRVALRVASLHDDWELGFIAQRMICSGVPLDEPYLQRCLSVLGNSQKNKLKEGRIPVSESFYLMGTADPTGVLNNDKVCVILDSGQISGKVLVYRNPGIHFGDIHVMDAVYVKEMEEFVGNAKYGIFFSTKGQRSAAYEMATGDFDGDMYWVSRNPELLKYFKASEPWRRVYPVPSADKRNNPQQCSELELEHELFQLFLEARKPSFNMGIATDSWLTYMDRLLTLGDDCAIEKNSLKTKMLKLIDIYYDALDAPKSGKKVIVPDDLKAEMFPHYMGRGPDYSYNSSSILGQIYDTVETFHNNPTPRKDICKLPCFNDDSILEDYFIMWKDRYASYCRDMAKAINSGDESKDDAAHEVIKTYKQWLYDAPNMEESVKDMQVIHDEATAIYHITYDSAISHKNVERCKFAWKVAGSALCNLCAWRSAGLGEKPLMILPSLLRDLLS